jgi:CDP-glucose 4,6-dehydratase
MDLDPSIWRGQRVLITGHTGFKGSWLALILKKFGAEVFGYSLPPNTSPSLYEIANIHSDLEHEFFGDITSYGALNDFFSSSNLDYVFHLAAQPLVRHSVLNPLETINTNVIGTANILAIALESKKIKGITVATTDKVYRNLGDDSAFRENDSLGGDDPYSASKASAELIVNSFISALNPFEIPVTTVRAGNVIGGGDWGSERLVPDLFRAIHSDEVLYLRNPDSTRPWQYILDCLRGYLLVAQNHLSAEVPNPKSVNFGPTDSLSVSNVLSLFQGVFGKEIAFEVVPSSISEHQYLRLNSQLALMNYGWEPVLTVNEAVYRTAKWYSDFSSGSDPRMLMLKEIEDLWSASI